MASASTKQYLYQEIEEKLRTQIAAGHWKSGAKFLSQREICREFGVSMITANRVLQNLTNDRLIERFIGRGNIVCSPGEGSRTPQRQWPVTRQGAVALISPDRANINLFFSGFYADVVQAILRETLHERRRLRMAYLPDYTERPANLLQTMAEPKKWLKEEVCGFILFGMSGYLLQAEYLAVESQAPAVLVDSYSELIPSVVTDNVGAVVSTFRNLRESGHRRIAFVGTQSAGSNYFNESERAAAARTLAPEFDLQLSERMLLRFDGEPDQLSELKKWLERDAVTALVTSTCRTLGKLDEVWPEFLQERSAVSVVSLDVFSAPFRPPREISGCAVDCESMGRAAYRLLMELADGRSGETSSRITIPTVWSQGQTLVQAGGVSG